MATRILIVAARNTTPGAFNTAFPEFGDELPHATSGWVWSCASLWCVDPDAIDPSRIEGPVVTITTCDDAVWYLRVHGAGDEPFGIANHHFLLDPEEIEFDESVAFGDFLPDLYEMVPQDCWPSAAVRELKTLAKRDALPKFLQMQANATSDALARFGIPHDRDSVVRCLSGESITEQELDAPLGNLPKFLECIGLDDLAATVSGKGEDDDRYDQPHDGHLHDDEYDDDDDEHALDIVGEVIAQTASIAPAALSEPVSYPLAGLHHVWLLSWFSNNDADFALTVDLPDGEAAEPTWPEQPVACEQRDQELDDEEDYEDEPGELTVHRAGQQIRVGVGWSSISRRVRWLQAIGKSLAEYPGDATISMLSAEIRLDEQGGESPGTQVYRGRITGDRFEITHTYPELDVDTLRDALALAAETDSTAPMQARSEDELEAVFAGAETSGLLFPLPEFDGLDVIHEDRHSLASVFFRERFAGSWPIAADDDLADLLGIGAAIGDAIANAVVGAPGADGVEVVFDGEFSRYRRAAAEDIDRPSLETLSESLDREFEKVRSRFRTEVLGESVETRTATRQDESTEFDPSSTESVNEAMAALGFEHMGDLVCDRFSDVTMRGFAPREGNAYGCHMRSLLARGVIEFVTSFTDGATFTTSTNPELQNLPHKGIYGRSLPDANPEQLLAEHRQSIEELAAAGREPVAVEPTLEGLAKAVDAFLVKQMS